MRDIAGAFAACPDHGTHYYWSHVLRVWVCPKDHDGDGLRELAPADVYLEHNERAETRVDGTGWPALYVVTFEVEEEDQ